MSRDDAPGWARALALTCTIALLLPGIVAAAAADCAGPDVQHDTVTSFDQTAIAVTTFRPCGVDGDRPAPAILTLHGWAGSRATTPDAANVAPMLAAGYGVVAIDARGHGESGGAAHIHQPDVEVRDFRAVLDWLHDEHPWIAHQPDSGVERDLVVGAHGGSYGGGFQLMTAAFDDRLDALVPAHAWNDLRQALAPNRGAVRSDWLTLLYGAAKTQATLAGQIEAWYLETMRENAVPHEADHHLQSASPAHWIERINVPTLLVQGMPDTLFNLNEAVANYRGLRDNGQHEVRLVATNDGHQLPVLQPTAATLAERPAGTTCVDLPALVADFFDAHLRNDATAAARLAAIPRVVLTTEQGGCVTGPDWPLGDQILRFPFSVLAAPNPAGTVLLPLFTAEEVTTIAGIPSVTGNTIIEFDDFLYLSLVVRSGEGLRVVGDQVTPLRVRPNPCDAHGAARLQAQAAPCASLLHGPSVTIELGGVATTLQPGDELLLAVEGFNPQFALNGNRRPGAAALTSVVVELPVARAS